MHSPSGKFRQCHNSNPQSNFIKHPRLPYSGNFWRFWRFPARPSKFNPSNCLNSTAFTGVLWKTVTIRQNIFRITFEESVSVKILRYTVLIFPSCREPIRENLHIGKIRHHTVLTTYLLKYILEMICT